MAKVAQRPIIDVEITLTLNSAEAAALAELAAWGADKAVDALAKAHGTKMLERHRVGLESLLSTSRASMLGILGTVEDCKLIMSGEKIAQYPKLKTG